MAIHTLVRFFMLVFAAGLFVVESECESGNAKAGGEEISFEIDGKFTKNFPTFTFVAGAHSKFGFQRKEAAKQKRELIAATPLNFNGTLTFRTARRVEVVGVSASFSLDFNQPDEDDAPITNRLERSIEKPTILWYGQFRFEERKKEVILGVRAKLSVDQIERSADDLPPNPLVDDVTLGFQGTLTGTKLQTTDSVGLFFNFGIKDETVYPRAKRNAADQITFKLNGKLTQQSRRPNGEVARDTVLAVTGEAVLDDYTGKEIPSPKEEFSKSLSRETVLIETDGTFKAKMNGVEVFAMPIKTELHGALPEEESNGKRPERNAPTNKNGTVEFEYKGKVSIETERSRKYGHPPFTYGVTTNVKFWEISKST